MSRLIKAGKFSSCVDELKDISEQLDAIALKLKEGGIVHKMVAQCNDEYSNKYDFPMSASDNLNDIAKNISSQVDDLLTLAQNIDEL